MTGAGGPDRSGTSSPAAARPARVRVTAPSPSARERSRRLAAGAPRDAAEQTEAGEVFIRSLIRSQLRLAVVVAGGFLVILLGFPVLLSVAPPVGAIPVFGIPFSWLLLGLGIYPVIGLSAWLYIRSAARNEDTYRDLAEER